MIALILALAATPAPVCPLTQDQVIETIAELGVEIVGSAHYSGMISTDMLVVQLPDSIVVYGFNAVGCLIGAKVIEPAKPRTGA